MREVRKVRVTLGFGRDFVLLLGQLISSLLGIIIMLYAKSDQSKPIFHGSVILFPTLIKACLP